jgi:hypothetical protein
MTDATLNDVVTELKKIRKLLKGTYSDESQAQAELNKPEV